MTTRLLALLAALMTTAATAQTAWVDRLQASCEQAMASGLCKLENASADYPASTATVLLGNQGRVPLATYLRVRASGNGMCTLAAGYCRTAPGGDECKVAKAMWGN
jgi:hypothetical protein